MYPHSTQASIHAPARGATVGHVAVGARKGASIHAPARGATLARPGKGIRCRLQSTLPHGERRVYLIRFAVFRCFNPRSRTGSDDWFAMDASNKLMLQSTLPHGERRHAPRLPSCPRCFNPRSRTGSDETQKPPLPPAQASIHAPARGATGKSGGVHGVKRFNPRSRTGSDAARAVKLTPYLASIHAPARGATLLAHHARQLTHASIHAPARGATIFVWISTSHP